MVCRFSCVSCRAVSSGSQERNSRGGHSREQGWVRSRERQGAEGMWATTWRLEPARRLRPRRLCGGSRSKIEGAFVWSTKVATVNPLMPRRRYLSRPKAPLSPVPDLAQKIRVTVQDL